MADIQFPHSSPDTFQRDVSPGQGTGTDVKATKQEVNYRPAGASRTACWSCRNFQRGGRLDTCLRVAGPIDSEWLCDLWQQAQGSIRDLVSGAPGGGYRGV